MIEQSPEDFYVHRDQDDLDIDQINEAIDEYKREFMVDYDFNTMVDYLD
jgi:hypothetical protein